MRSRLRREVRERSERSSNARRRIGGDGEGRRTRLSYSVDGHIGSHGNLIKLIGKLPPRPVARRGAPKIDRRVPANQ